MEIGTRASLDVKCHHHHIFCRVNLKLNPPPPHDQKVWHYDRANARLLRRSIDNLNWEGLFNQNSDPNWQVHFFIKTLLNIFSNFIPNELLQ